MNNKLFFKTAEFAKLCLTTKHTLIHYDEIGLLKPDKISENKYRYYSIAQFDEYNTISELRTMGIPLKEIKETLYSSTPNNFKSLLEQQKHVLQNKLDTLQNTVKSIDTQLTEIQNFLETKPNEVCIHHFSELPIVLTHKTILPNPASYMEHYGELISQIPSGKRGTAFRIGAIKSLQQVQQNENDAYTHFYLPTPNNHTSTLRKAGKYLVTYYVGNFEDIIPSYKRLIKYAKKNTLTIDDIFYEEIIINRIATGNQEYIVQIMVRVQD